MYGLKLAWPCVAVALTLNALSFDPNLPNSAGPPITVVMHFDGPTSVAAVEALEREFTQVMHAAGLAFDYKLRDELDPDAHLTQVLMVTFKGSCRMDRLDLPFHKRGALAFTHISDGVVLPFAEVECDRVRARIRRGMNGDQLKNGDAVLGRALARVLAHEAYHMLARTREHGSCGIAQSAVSPQNLLADRFEFDREDVQRIRAGREDNRPEIVGGGG